MEEFLTKDIVSTGDILSVFAFSEIEIIMVMTNW